MIRKDETPPAAGTEGISGLLREMAGMCDPADETALHAVRAVAAGVQTFLADENDAGRASSHVRALVSRALICSGKQDMASRLLLVGGGLVKQSQSALAATGTVLILDLKPLARRADDCLDMVFRRCVLLLVDSMAHMWDETQGRGILGLRNVRVVARHILGRAAGPKPVDALAREIKSLCEERLDSLRRRRNWSECPVVSDMDWITKTGKKRRRRNAP